MKTFAQASWLSIKMHRLDAALAIVLGLAAAAVVAWVASEIQAAAIPSACWPRETTGSYAAPGCDAAALHFYSVASSVGNPARVILAAAPVILGAILGVPIVGRELELRTAEIAWSLGAGRRRWLFHRAVPYFMITLLLAGTIATAGAWLFESLLSGLVGPDLSEVSSMGLPMLVRALLAASAAMFVGLILGRTMPSLIVAVATLAVWGLVVIPFANGLLVPGLSRWEPNGDEAAFNSLPGLVSIDDALFDTSQPGLRGEPGLRFDWADHEARTIELCGEMPPEDAKPSDQAVRDWAMCAEGVPIPQNMGWSLVVPATELPVFQRMVLAVDGVAIVALLAASASVVVRRRPM